MTTRFADLPDGLPKALNWERIRAGQTLRSAAEEVGIHFTYLSKLEHGTDRPSDDLVKRLDKLYGSNGVLVGLRSVEPCPRCGRTA